MITREDVMYAERQVSSAVWQYLDENGWNQDDKGLWHITVNKVRWCEATTKEAMNMQSFADAVIEREALAGKETT